jgi:hypothetical protein
MTQRPTGKAIGAVAPGDMNSLVMIWFLQYRFCFPHDLYFLNRTRLPLVLKLYNKKQYRNCNNLQ